MSDDTPAAPLLRTCSEPDCDRNETSPGGVVNGNRKAPRDIPPVWWCPEHLPIERLLSGDVAE